MDSTNKHCISWCTASLNLWQSSWVKRWYFHDRRGDDDWDGLHCGVIGEFLLKYVVFCSNTPYSLRNLFPVMFCSTSPRIWQEKKCFALWVLKLIKSSTIWWNMSRSSGATGMIARNDKTLPRLDSLSMFGPYCAFSTGFLHNKRCASHVFRRRRRKRKRRRRSVESWDFQGTATVHPSYNQKWNSTFH